MRVLGVRHDVPGEAAERVAARAACVHQRGDAGEHTGQIGVHRGLVHALVNVCVQIDQPRCHQLAGHVDHAGAAVRGDVRRDFRDKAAADCHVEPCARPTRWVDNIAAFQYQVSHFRGSFRRGLRCRALGPMVYHAALTAQHGTACAGWMRPGTTGSPRRTVPMRLFQITSCPKHRCSRENGKAKSVNFCDILCVS